MAPLASATFAPIDVPHFNSCLDKVYSFLDLTNVKGFDLLQIYSHIIEFFLQY